MVCGQPFIKKGIKMYSELIFAVHGGTYGSKPAGIIMSDHCLPIAVRESSDNGDDGFFGLWQSTCNIEEFFEILNIDHCPQAGLYYLRAEFTDEDVDSDDDRWNHLVFGKVGVPKPVHVGLMSVVIEQTKLEKHKAFEPERWMWL